MIDGLVQWSPVLIAVLIGYRAWKGDAIRGVYALLGVAGVMLMLGAEGDAELSVPEHIAFLIGMGLLLGSVLGVCLYRKRRRLLSEKP